MFKDKLPYKILMVTVFFISIPKSIAKPHLHGTRLHNHNLPSLGIKHRHGNSEIGKNDPEEKQISKNKTKFAFLEDDAPGDNEDQNIVYFSKKQKKQKQKQYSFVEADAAGDNEDQNIVYFSKKEKEKSKYIAKTENKKPINKVRALASNKPIPKSKKKAIHKEIKVTYSEITVTTTQTRTKSQ